jgi:hypothetical protein
MQGTIARSILTSDEAPPHLCHARSAAAADRSRCAHDESQRRDAIRPRRARDDQGGTKVRFRIIGGSFKIVVRGRGINLSLVGKGNVTLNGADTGDDGTYSVNGGDYSAVPGFPSAFPLSANSP